MKINPRSIPWRCDCGTLPVMSRSAGQWRIECRGCGRNVVGSDRAALINTWNGPGGRKPIVFASESFLASIKPDEWLPYGQMLARIQTFARCGNRLAKTFFKTLKPHLARDPKTRRYASNVTGCIVGFFGIFVIMHRCTV